MLLVGSFSIIINCERSIFVHWSVEGSTLSSTTGAAIGWQQDHITSDFENIQRLFHLVYAVHATCLGVLDLCGAKCSLTTNFRFGTILCLNEGFLGRAQRTHGAQRVCPLMLASKRIQVQDCFQFSGSLLELLGPGPALGAGAAYWCGTQAPARPGCTIHHHATPWCTMYTSVHQ